MLFLKKYIYIYLSLVVDSLLDWFTNSVVDLIKLKISDMNYLRYPCCTI